jgi:hypothetical protein
MLVLGKVITGIVLQMAGAQGEGANRCSGGTVLAQTFMCLHGHISHVYVHSLGQLVRAHLPHVTSSLDPHHQRLQLFAILKQQGLGL